MWYPDSYRGGSNADATVCIQTFIVWPGNHNEIMVVNPIKKASDLLGLFWWYPDSYRGGSNADATVCIQTFIVWTGHDNEIMIVNPIKKPRIYRGFSGGRSRDRTGDTRIFSPLLYQLSYPTKIFFQLSADEALPVCIQTFASRNVRTIPPKFSSN